MTEDLSFWEKHMKREVKYSFAYGRVCKFRCKLFANLDASKHAFLANILTF